MTEPNTLHPRRFAAWHARLLAYLVDVVPIVALFVVLALLDDDSGSYSHKAVDGNGTSSGFSLQVSGFPALILFVVTIAWFVYNWLIRQGSTGQTVGKKVMDIAVLDQANRPIGAGLTFARQLAHVLDFLPCFLGYLWPLWDKEKRTFADMMVGTRVHRV